MDRIPDKMKALVRRLLASAAIAAFTLDPAASGATVTETYPEGLVVEALDDDALDEWSPSDRVRILRSFARDPRTGVRAATAAQLRHLSIPLSHAGRKLVAELACDESPEVQMAASRSLAVLLAGMPGLDRTNLVCKWSSSGRDGLELAVARALQYSVDVLGGDTAIEHLAMSHSAQVREAAARAAWVRRTLQPARFDIILTRLESDPDPHVATIARLAHAG